MDFHPHMARGVELGNARNFISWTKQQPWMVLHEMAHAYNDQVIGDDPRIKAAHEEMKKSGAYESVPYIGGGKKRHYALENEKEYFAESTEAFFGKNDFYPFVRAELEKADPRICALLKELWGRP